jgi:hypothetical protein
VTAVQHEGIVRPRGGRRLRLGACTSGEYRADSPVGGAGCTRLHKRAAPADRDEGASHGDLSSTQSAPPAGLAVRPSRGGKRSDASRLRVVLQRLGSGVDGNAHPLADRCGRELPIEGRRSPQAVGNPPPRRSDRSEEHEFSRGHVEVECLPATPLFFAVRRRHHTRRWLIMGGSEA